MRISIHAAKRFLERVMSKKAYIYKDIDFALKFLEKTFKDVVPTGYSRQFVVPGFKNYKAIYRQNTIVTIIPKQMK